MLSTLKRVSATGLLACAGLLIAGAPHAFAQHESAKYEGRRLTEALRALQSHGLRIVFSSETVTRDMRVKTEPRATAPRRVLDELLEPHGLKAQDGPRHVIQVIRAKAAPAPSDSPKRPAVKEPIEPPGASYSERVTVRPAPHWRSVPVGSEASLVRRDLEGLAGVLADDPMRAVHALPGVATGDDFRSEFSVRGSPYRHIGVVVDGVATPWLQHAAYGRGDTGSLAMLPGDVLEQATLQAGAYPYRDGDRLGAQIAFTLRQGSRSTTQVRGAASGTNAVADAEGPIGGSQRGSWLFSLRQSYRDWPVQDLREFGGTVFGFTDAQAKLVYDVRPSQQVSFTFVGGRSYLDKGDDRAAYEFGDGSNQAAVVNVGWRSTLGQQLVVTQRGYAVDHRFVNKQQTEQEVGRGSDRELSYRIDLIRTHPRGVFEAGGQIQLLQASRHRPPLADTLVGPEPRSFAAFAGSSSLRSAYAHATWAVTPQIAIAPGVRVTDSTLVQRRTISPWILGKWSITPGWMLNVSTGVSHQFPEFEHVFGTAGSRGLGPERATHVDVGIGQQLGPTIRWQATIFNRRERDVLRAPEAAPGAYANALSGAFRGVELMMERRSATGLSGWASYAWGTSRYSDEARRETFWADFDQRHAVNLAGLYRLSERTQLSARFRAGTNFPVPGYLTARDGAIFAGDRRNEVRLPGYARLDVRASRTFTYADRRLTLFAEVVNVLNRTNVGLSNGVVHATGSATGFTETLFRRRPAGGIVIEF